jgi:tRNA-dihydrouridine synthase
VHARVASRKHSGPADWDLLAEVKARAGTLAVIGNGGIGSGTDAVRAFTQSGVDAVMVGRGAIGNPWIFREIRAALSGATAVPRTLDEVRSAVREQLEVMRGLQKIARRETRKDGREADRAVSRMFRGHLVKYLAGLRGWADVRRRLEAMGSTREVLEAVEYVLALEANAGAQAGVVA